MSTAKAWVAFVGSMVTAVAAALSDDMFDINDTSQVVVAFIAGVATLYATYKIPNTPKV